MAKPKVLDDRVTVQVVFERSLVERLDVVAQAAKISRSQLLRNLLELALDDAELFKKMGLLGLIVRLRDMRKEGDKHGLPEAVSA
jgi:metal-responsive CopG/Arc/MetJ family transcriptional regulator